MAESVSSPTFRTADGRVVPAVTAGQMREVDRIAVEDLGLTILQMMENAGRNLAENVVDMLEGQGGEVLVLAGSGGNGGGGLCCARHLHNRGLPVSVVLSKAPADLTGAAAHQLRILEAVGVEPLQPGSASQVIRRSQLVVDALIGYSLHGAPRGRVAELIALCRQGARRVLSLDLPSGRDATTGETPGAVIRSERTLTLALPKTGLQGLPGEIYLADIGIPPEAYQPLGFSFEWPSRDSYWVPIEQNSPGPACVKGGRRPETGPSVQGGYPGPLQG